MKSPKNSNLAAGVVESMSKNDIELELAKILDEESVIDAELREYFAALSAPKSFASSKRLAFDSVDLNNNLRKIESFAPCFEAMAQDSKKLASQIDDCRGLSDRLSLIVRRLDTIQMRAQQALACTEDVMNLKDCKYKILSAIEENNLPLAVSFIKQIHDIDQEAVKSSDDYESIQQSESKIRDMVRRSLTDAIQAADTNSVMSLCPLLQTMGLEVEARDSFLDFMEQTVFVAISADAASVDGATDAATGYAQALSNVFNSSYLILQKYLPMVIQGMESSMGDIMFMRRLHSKCEQESGLVLKRYMKFRNIKEVISSIKLSNSNSSTQAAGKISVADMHNILDELALLIQYCCMYSKYLKVLCQGAESRKRQGVSPGQVFTGPTDFDRMVDELINKYYMEGEHWLLRLALRSALPKTFTSDQRAANLALDECFFVLQRCGQRAIGTNNIHAACAILHMIPDLMSSDLASQAADLLNTTAVKVGAVLQENMARYIKPGSMDTSASLSMGLINAMSLSSITGTSNASASTNKGIIDDGGSGGLSTDGTDPWKVGMYMEAINAVEKCTKYSERLLRDISQSTDAVFGSSLASNNSNSSNLNNKSNTTSSNSNSSKTGSNGSLFSGGSHDVDKINLCKDEFDNLRNTFQLVLRQGIEKILAHAQTAMKDLLVSSLGKNGPLGGVRFDMTEDKFDNQPAVALLPKMLLTPFEIIASICTSSLSETNKDVMVGMLADVCAERLEHFITKNSFRFSGALKIEECVRAVTAVFTKITSSNIRGKFSRLREVLVVLTSDVSIPGGVPTDNFSHLTSSEVFAVLSLRVDGVESLSLNK